MSGLMNDATVETKPSFASRLVIMRHQCWWGAKGLQTVLFQPASSGLCGASDQLG
jgi:hypothetical protein